MNWKENGVACTVPVVQSDTDYWCQTTARYDDKTLDMDELVLDAAKRGKLATRKFTECLS